MGPQDTLSPASLQVWEVYRSPLRLEISKHFSDTYKSFSWETGVGVLGAEGWGGGADCGFHSGEVEGSRPRCPLSLAVSGVGFCPTRSGSSWKIGVTLYGVSVSTLTWQLRIRGPWD